MNKSMFVKSLINVIGVALFAFLISRITLFDLTALSYFSPTEKNIDFRSSDFYQLVADSRQERRLDTNIVVVPIDGLSRQEVLTVLEDIYASSPSVVGLDAFFPYPSDNDKPLYEFLQSHSNLILPMAVEQLDEDMYGILPMYLYDSLSTDRMGVVNMNVVHPYNTVRDFVMKYQTPSGEVYNFAAAISRLADPEAFEKLQKRLADRGECLVDIDFPSWEYTCINPDELLVSSQELEGKVVMVGDISNPQDFHVTPIGDNVPGVIIHANAISTVLNEGYHSKFPMWGLVIMVVVLCVLFVIFRTFLFSLGEADNMVMRIVQILMLFMVIWVGTRLYIHHNIILELSVPLVIIALVQVALDFWAGFLAAVRWAVSKVASFSERCKSRKK